MIFHAKDFLCCSLLTDQIQLSYCHYFWRYWAIHELLLFVSQFVTLLGLEIIAAFSSCHFPTLPKKSEQKFKSFNNEKSLQGEIKSIFQNFERVLVAKNCHRFESEPLNIDKKHKVI